MEGLKVYKVEYQGECSWIICSLPKEAKRIAEESLLCEEGDFQEYIEYISEATVIELSMDEKIKIIYDETGELVNLTCREWIMRDPEEGLLGTTLY